MMFTAFHMLISYSYIFFYEMSVQIMLIFVILLNFKGSLYSLEMSHLTHTHTLWRSPILCFAFHFLNGVFRKADVLVLLKSNLSMFPFIVYIYSMVTHRSSLCLPIVAKTPLIFSSRNRDLSFIACMIYFE